MTVEFRGTPLLDKIINAPTRVVVNQGGSRSSKTWSTCQMVVAKCLTETDKTFTIVRKTWPALRDTIQKDLFDILRGLNLYNDDDHWKQEHRYRLNGNDIYFVSCDEEKKIRGRRNNYVILNEANELDYDHFFQFNLRLSNPSGDGNRNQIFLDYNPSDEYHWIYEKVLTRPDVTFIQSTYKDNPFLDPETIAEIESIQYTDENYWRVFGLGERGISGTTIYPNFGYCTDIPADASISYGLDFGFNHPTALVRVGLAPGSVYWDELIHRSGLTSVDLIALMSDLVPDRRARIYADGARPEMIADIVRAGWVNCVPADKNVFEGIDAIKKNKLFLTERSTNLIKEVRAYKWKTDRAGRVLDEPVKINDDGVDAGRYGTFSAIARPNRPTRFNTGIKRDPYGQR